MHAGKNLRYATAYVRRDSSGAGELGHFRVIRLPGYLARNVDGFRWVNVRAVSFVQEECRRIDGAESPIPRLNGNPHQVLIVRATRQTQKAACCYHKG